MPQPELLDNSFAASNMAYTITNGGKPDAGWREVTYPANSDKGKLLATAEAHELVAPNGQHYVAFTGTNRAGDLGPDVGNFLGVKTEKYQAAAQLGELYKNEHVVMTGHSLGGGLAKTAAAVASHGAEQTVCVGFNGAPIGTRVLKDHGVDPNHLESETIQVVNRYDALNRYTWGGKTHAYGGNAIADGNANEVTVLAEGKGSSAGISGHRLTNLEDPNHPGHLTTQLQVNGSAVDKASFDRFAQAQQALDRPHEVVKAMEHAAPAQQMEVSRGR